MVDHVPCYYRLARDKPVVRRRKTYPVTNLLNKLLLDFGPLSVPVRRMPWSGASSRGRDDAVLVVVVPAISAVVVVGTVVVVVETVVVVMPVVVVLDGAAPDVVVVVFGLVVVGDVVVDGAVVGGAPLWWSSWAGPGGPEARSLWSAPGASSSAPAPSGLASSWDWQVVVVRWAPSWWAPSSWAPSSWVPSSWASWCVVVVGTAVVGTGWWVPS